MGLASIHILQYVLGKLEYTSACPECSDTTSVNRLANNQQNCGLNEAANVSLQPLKTQKPGSKGNHLWPLYGVFTLQEKLMANSLTPPLADPPRSTWVGYVCTLECNLKTKQCNGFTDWMDKTH